MTYEKVKKNIVKNKQKHTSFSGKIGHGVLGAIAGWSAHHWFINSGGETGAHGVFIIETILDAINQLGGLTVVVSASIAIYTVYIKGRKQAK